MEETHVVQNEGVDDKTKASLEKKINAHAGMWTGKLNAGAQTTNHHRIRSIMKSRNNPPAPLSILQKDHKTYENVVIGPLERQECGGNVSHNRILSHMTSISLTDVYIAITEDLLEVGRLNNEKLDEW